VTPTSLIAQRSSAADRLSETSFEPGREFLGPLEFQDQLDRSFDG
jgi:hypothetical protein